MGLTLRKELDVSPGGFCQAFVLAKVFERDSLNLIKQTA